MSGFSIQQHERDRLAHLTRRRGQRAARIDSTEEALFNEDHDTPATRTMNAQLDEWYAEVEKLDKEIETQREIVEALDRQYGAPA